MPARGAVSVLCVSVLAAAGCAPIDEPPEIHDVTRPPTSAGAGATSGLASRTPASAAAHDTRGADQVRPAPPRVETSNAGIQRVLDEIAPLLPAGVVIALAPVGRADEVGRVGAADSGGPYPADLTIALPVAAATMRDRPDLSTTMDTMLREFDAAAGEQLVDGLGQDPATALTEALADAGDDTTQIAADDMAAGEPLRGGDVLWAVADQARFLSGLPCRDYGGGIVWDMGTVVESLRWGLGALPNAHFVSAERPATGDDPAYVRQAGILHVDGGDLAVAIATEAESVDAGRQAVTSTVEQVQQRLGLLYGGTCTP